MKAQLSNQHIRLRLDPGDLSQLQSESAVEISVAAPGRDGDLQELAIRLTVDTEANDAWIQIRDRLIGIHLREQDVSYLADPAHEGVRFTQEVNDDSDLACVVEKDMHSFARIGVTIPRSRARARG